jgi:hypothetical protein
MAAIHPLFTAMTFEPEVVQAMGMAFDLACKQLQDTGQSDLLAKRIIELANRGVTDHVELCKGALIALGKDKVG